MTSPLEALAFAMGIKPALRLSLSPADAAREAGLWRARGAVVIERGGYVYAARDLEHVTALCDAESEIPPDGPRRTPDETVRSAHRELGRRLGYPPCCVQAFLERLERGVQKRPDGTEAAEVVVAAEIAWSSATRRYARLNFLLPRRRALVPFQPCAFDCESSLEYAEALHREYQRRESKEAADLEAALKKDVVLGRRGPLTAGASEPAVLTLRWDGF